MIEVDDRTMQEMLEELEYTNWLLDLATQFLDRANHKIAGYRQTIEKLQIKIGQVQK